MRILGWGTKGPDSDPNRGLTGLAPISALCVLHVASCAPQAADF